jgi:hypothetical protein
MLFLTTMERWKQRSINALARLVCRLALGAALFLPMAESGYGQQCEGFVLPPTLALTSFDGTFVSFGSGFQVGGVTDTLGCVVAATQSIMGYSLSSFISGAIPVAVEYFVFDNGALLPFLPYASGGEITWFTLRISDGSVGALLGFTTLLVIPT